MTYIPVKTDTLFLSNVASDIATYKRVYTPPFVSGVEGTSIGSGATGAEVLINSFSSAALGLLSFSAGDVTLNLYAKVSMPDGVTTIKAYVYQRTLAGIETLLGSASSMEINSLSAVLVPITVTIPLTATAITDRIIIKLYHVTTYASSVTTTLYQEGSPNQSRARLPFEFTNGNGDMERLIYDADGNGIIDANRLGNGTPSSSNYLSGDGTWKTPAGGGAGDVVGPAAAADSHLAMFDGVTGKLLKDGGVSPATITPANTVSNETSFNITPGAGASAAYSRADHTHGTPATPAGAGDMIGPTVSIDGHLVVFDGVTGKLVKDGGAVPTGGGGVAPALKIYLATNFS